MLSIFLVALLCLLIRTAAAAAATQSSASPDMLKAQGNFTGLTDAFPQLANLTQEPHTGRSIGLGGQGTRNSPDIVIGLN